MTTIYRLEALFDDEDTDDQAALKRFKQGERSLKGKQWNILYEKGFDNKIISTLGEAKRFKIVFNDGAERDDSATYFLCVSAYALAMIASVVLAFWFSIKKGLALILVESTYWY